MISYRVEIKDYCLTVRARVFIFQGCPLFGEKEHSNMELKKSSFLLSTAALAVQLEGLPMQSSERAWF